MAVEFHNLIPWKIDSTPLRKIW